MNMRESTIGLSIQNILMQAFLLFDIWFKYKIFAHVLNVSKYGNGYAETAY
jgi:hypothetical protein